MDIEQIYILVVDDLVDAADTTVELLSIWGYEAIASYTGTSALESARLRRPSVVILDLAMPLMDGFEFAGLFQELPECGSVPLIALSGYSSLPYRVRAHEVGIRHYLLKPADHECLKDLLALEVVRRAAPTALHWRVPAVASRWSSQDPSKRILRGVTTPHCDRLKLRRDEL